VTRAPGGGRGAGASATDAAVARTDVARIRLEAAVDACVPSRLAKYREQLLYLVTGGWNTVFGYAVWALLQTLLHKHLHYLVILALSYPVSTANAYLCYRYVVFRSHGSPWREVPRFSLVYVATMVTNLALLPILLEVLPFSVYVTQALFAVFVVICSYLGHRHFSFRDGRVARAGAERRH
jgi:putative flippase GtrA